MIAAATPEISPPRNTGTSTTSTSGRSWAISSPIAPWPEMTSGWSNGGIIGLPVAAASSRAG